MSPRDAGIVPSKCGHEGDEGGPFPKASGRVRGVAGTPKTPLSHVLAFLSRVHPAPMFSACEAGILQGASLVLHSAYHCEFYSLLRKIARFYPTLCARQRHELRHAGRVEIHLFGHNTWRDSETHSRR